MKCVSAVGLCKPASASVASPHGLWWDHLPASRFWLKPCLLFSQSPNSVLTNQDQPHPTLHPNVLPKAQEGCLDPDKR